jgi:uncharacterized RDD family membrane protein YckC
MLDRRHPSACPLGRAFGSPPRRTGYRLTVTDQQAASGENQVYPGEHFGLPESGAGSIAGWSRRAGALLIDWFICSLIAIAFLYHPTAGHAANVFVEPRAWTPVVFLAEDWLLTATAGFTIGKRLTGLRVIRLDGHQPVGFGRALIRTVLLMLVVPAMMMDRDLRGLQDKAAGTVVIRA